MDQNLKLNYHSKQRNTDTKQGSPELQDVFSGFWAERGNGATNVTHSFIAF